MAFFSSLNIHSEGVGDYRLNRFRIYFTIPPERLDPTGQKLAGRPYDGHPVDRMGDLVLQNFPTIFNPGNVAQMSFGASYKWKGRDTLRFKLAAALQGEIGWTAEDFVVPDLHTDWVGVEYADPTVGFTVQTLRRNFREVGDWLAAAPVYVGASIATAVHSGVPWRPKSKRKPDQFIQDDAFYDTADYIDGANMQHALAGRRTWAVRPASWFGMHGVQNPADLVPGAFAIETAAIERFSSTMIRMFDAIKLMGDFDGSLREVWVVFMNNFVRQMGFEILPVRVWNSVDRNVSHVVEAHATRGDCESSGEHAEIVRRFQAIYER